MSPERIGYVLKMYPRFSETFIVSELLGREARGADIEVFSLRPPVDPRFHSALLCRPLRRCRAWSRHGGVRRSSPFGAARRVPRSPPVPRLRAPKPQARSVNRARRARRGTKIRRSRIPEPWLAAWTRRCSNCGAPPYLPRSTPAAIA